jgi:hypothetical protein
MIFAGTKEGFQVATQLLNKINYNLDMSAEKMKSMVFCGKHQTRSTMRINGKTVEKFQNFSYLGCDISHNYD